MTTLAEIAQVNPRLTASLADDEPVSFLGMADVSEGGSTNFGEIRPYRAVKKGFTPFSNGDILVAKITPCFENGKIAQATTSLHHAFGSTEFHVVRVNEALADARYVLHLLRTPRLRLDGERRMTGSAGQRRVPKAFLDALEIPLPPIPEQRRIAAILDQVDELRTMRRRALSLLDELVAQQLEVVVRSGAWPTHQISEVADTQGGLTVNRRRVDLPLQVSYLRVANVSRGAIDLREVKRLGVTESELKRVVLRDGDLLVVEGHGNQSEVGRVARWTGDAEMTHQNHLIRVRPAKDKLDPVFAECYLNGHAARSYFRSVAKTTSGLNTINVSNVRNAPILLPSITVQCDFADFVRSIEILRRLNLAALTAHEALFASLQHRAFRGEL